MIKKSGMLLFIFIIIAALSMPVFAGNTEGTGDMGAATVNNSYTGLPADSATGAQAGALGSGEEGTAAPGVTQEPIIKVTPFEEEYNRALKNGQALNTGETIMVITSPDKDKDSTYKKTYIISGNSSYNDVIISVARLNKDTNEYELIYNTDGEKSWGIGASGIFSKEIVLDKGVNNLMFISYRKSEMEESKIQFNSATIELLNEGIKNKVLQKLSEIKNDISDGFNAYGNFWSEMIK